MPQWEHIQFLGILHSVLINLIEEMGHRTASKSAAHFKKKRLKFCSAGLRALLGNCCIVTELVLVSKPFTEEEKRELRTQADAEQHECESSVSAVQCWCFVLRRNQHMGKLSSLPIKALHIVTV